jgi:hypothetical protein
MAPPSPRIRPTALALAALLPAVLLVGCGDDGPDAFSEGRRIPAEQATVLAVVGDRLVIGERLTGRVTSLDLSDGAGEPDPTEITTIEDLDPDPAQGGLLGAVALDDDTVAISLTNADGRLEVREVDLASGEAEQRWLGPPSEEQANGGRLAVLADGSLVIGIGDLLDPDRSDDPDQPNGKLLTIAPDGTTAPFAGPFNNPFAMAGDGEAVWVADNAPGARPERLLRATAEGIDEIADWTETRVPAGVAVLEDGRLALCNYATTSLGIVDPDDPGDAAGDEVADDCRYAVATLPDGGLAYAAEDEVVLLGPPS